MRVGRRIVALFGILPLAACAVVGPVVDAGMDDAPYQACIRFAEAPAPAEPPAPAQCVSVQVRPAGGQWQPFTGTLSAGDTLLALPSAAPQCNHGNYTHFVLEGASESGAMRVAVPDAFGRGDRGRAFAWTAPRGRWTADNIGTSIHTPAGARVSLTEGQVRLSSACFKSYTGYRIPRAHGAAGEGEAHDAH
ncbi:MAG TPA: hypothetical protein VMG08_10010 [Allosphingosinicella sp.]|nr:hypothetical protein [Allosphingosinicella sp.]